MSDHTHAAPVRRKLARLRKIGAELATVDRLYEQRARIIVELRHADPPVKMREIADAAGMSENAVHQAYRQATGKRKGAGR